MISYKIAILIAIISTSLASGVIYLLSIRPANNQVRLEKTLTDEVLGTTTEVSPSATITTSPAINAKTVSTQFVKPSSTPTSIPTSTPSPLPTPDTRIDSATHIELCKVEAEKTKRLSMEFLVVDFNNNNRESVEYAQTSGLPELEQVAIKYGRIKNGDLERNYDAVATALYNAGAIAKKFVGEFMNSVEYKGEGFYNGAYAKCLSEKR